MGMGKLSRSVNDFVQGAKRKFKSLEANNPKKSMKHLKRGPGSPAGPNLKSHPKPAYGVRSAIKKEQSKRNGPR